MSKTKACERCGKEFEDKHRDGKRFCSVTCAALYRAGKYVNGMTGKTKDKNPNWRGGNERHCMECGTVFTDKHYEGQRFCSKRCSGKFNARRRMPIRDDRQCPTCGCTFTPRREDAKYCSQKCYVANSNFAEIQGRRFRGKTPPESARQAVSKSNSVRLAESVYTSGNNGFYESKKAGRVFYRSSYELIAFKMLDDRASVSGFRPEPLLIEYANTDGNIRRYRPDILIEWVDGSMTLVEVKPMWQLSDENVKRKLHAGAGYAKQRNWRFEVWTEIELGIQQGPTPAREGK